MCSWCLFGTGIEDFPKGIGAVTCERLNPILKWPFSTPNRSCTSRPELARHVPGELPGQGWADNGSEGGYVAVSARVAFIE
jgi:hypothetical protein